MVAKIIGAQRDFSFGEIDVALKRSDDHPARKAGLRQMANARILNSNAIQNRSGRRALYPITNNGIRTERFTISAGNIFDIQFAAGRLKIIDATGTTVANFTTQGGGAALPWASSADINTIVYAILNLSIYIAFASMRPQVITWDGVATWTIADYNELVSIGGQKRTPFYRLSPQNVTLLPSATTGAITVTFSSPIAVAGMAGTRIRWAGRQILLGTVINTSSMNATVIEPLPPAETLTLTSSTGKFTVGDLVIGNSSGAQGIVISSPNTQYLNLPAFGTLPGIGSAVTGGTSGATGVVTGTDGAGNIAVSLNLATAFVAGETISGTWGSATVNSVTTTSLVVQLLQVGNTAPSFVAETIGAPGGTAVVSTATPTTPKAISVWDDEVFNAFRGYPASVFTDQFRIGFCDFPSIPGAIAWSAINSATDLYIGANPSNAMFEIAPGKVRVLYVVPGPESSEFVFCDKRVYYIPVSPANPLRPGGVQFLTLSGDGAGRVHPRLAQEAILYANSGQNSIMAVIATGAYYRPFNTKNLSLFHAHLFNSIQAIAVPSTDGSFTERYGYVLNGDGSIAVGKYDAASLTTNQPVIGWGRWSGAATVSWIAANSADVIFTSTYFGVGIVEILDDTQYLDAALSVNAAPTAFAPPAGKGPLWFIPSQTVSLMDQVTRSMGTYQIDANGFIIPQANAGENLAIASLVAGQPWTMTVEPFVPDANPGTDVGQRMFKRRVSRFAIYVVNSTGFLMARLFSGPITRTSPSLGTVMNQRRVPAWNQDDDPTKPPPLREEAQRWRPIGRAFDPRIAIIKDTPGPLLISEIGIEATV